MTRKSITQARRINYVPFILKRLIGLLLLPLLPPSGFSRYFPRSRRRSLRLPATRCKSLSVVVALGRRDTVRLPRARPEETSSACSSSSSELGALRAEVCERRPGRQVETGRSVEREREQSRRFPRVHRTGLVRSRARTLTLMACING